MDVQEEKPSMGSKLTAFLRNIVRVLRVASKPSGEEYKASLKITGIGLIVMGLVGYVIFVIFQFVGIF